MTTEQIDQAKAEAFAGKIMGILNSGFIAPVISIGHRTGLFDALAGAGAVTSAELAKKTGLQERYVREWLAGMVVSGIVEYDASASRYRLPDEHAGFLTRAAGPNNMAFFAQYVALAGNVEDGVVEAFRSGGGVPYSAYPKFQELQAEESARLFDIALADVIIGFAEGVRPRLEAGIDAADIGTGQGHAVNVLAKAFPKSRFTGLDFSDEGVAAGAKEAKSMGLKNATFRTQDLAKDIPGKYDLITAFDMVHDLAAPRTVLKNVAKALKPGGTFLVMDMAGSSKLEENLDHPLGQLLYAASLLHCMTVSLSQGGEGVGTMWGEQMAQEYLRGAGFKEITVSRIPDDPMHVFYSCRLA